jgi:hypothetical protein
MAIHFPGNVLELGNEVDQSIGEPLPTAASTRSSSADQRMNPMEGRLCIVEDGPGDEASSRRPSPRAAAARARCAVARSGPPFID